MTPNPNPTELDRIERATRELAEAEPLRNERRTVQHRGVLSKRTIEMLSDQLVSGDGLTLDIDGDVEGLCRVLARAREKGWRGNVRKYSHDKKG